MPANVDLDDRGEPVGQAPAGRPAVTFGRQAPRPAVLAGSRGPAVPTLFASRPDILLATPRLAASTSAPAEPCADCGGVPESPAAVSGGVTSPIHIEGNLPGSLTDTVLIASPLRDAVTQIGSLATGDAKVIASMAPAKDSGFHMSMALVLLGVGLVALALWKLE